MTRDPVLDALVDWLIELHARGGHFSADAVQTAGEAAIAAEESGLSAQQAFDVGRSTYVEQIEASGRGRVSEFA